MPEQKIVSLAMSREQNFEANYLEECQAAASAGALGLLDSSDEGDEINFCLHSGWDFGLHNLLVEEHLQARRQWKHIIFPVTCLQGCTTKV